MGRCSRRFLTEYLAELHDGRVGPDAMHRLGLERTLAILDGLLNVVCGVPGSHIVSIELGAEHWEIREKVRKRELGREEKQEGRGGRDMD